MGSHFPPPQAATALTADNLSAAGGKLKKNWRAFGAGMRLAQAYMTPNYTAAIVRTPHYCMRTFRRFRPVWALFTVTKADGSASTPYIDRQWGSPGDTLGAGAAARQQGRIEFALEYPYTTATTGIPARSTVGTFGGQSYFGYDYAIMNGQFCVIGDIVDPGQDIVGLTPFGLWSGIGFNAAAAGGILPYNVTGSNFYEDRGAGYIQDTYGTMAGKVASASSVTPFGNGINNYTDFGYSPCFLLIETDEGQFEQETILWYGHSVPRGTGDGTNGIQRADVMGNTMGYRGWADQYTYENGFFGANLCIASDKAAFCATRGNFTMRAQLGAIANPTHIGIVHDINDWAGPQSPPNFANNTNYARGDHFIAGSLSYLVEKGGLSAVSGTPDIPTKWLKNGTTRITQVGGNTQLDKNWLFAKAMMQHLRDVIPNVPIGWATSMPYTGSSDNYTTVANQSFTFAVYGDGNSVVAQWDYLIRTKKLGNDFHWELGLTGIYNQFSLNGDVATQDGKWAVHPTSMTFTAAVSAATSATLDKPWEGLSGPYIVTFSDGSTRAVNLVHKSTAVTWTGAVASATTAATCAFSVVFSAAPNASTIGTLATAWTGESGNYRVTFSDTSVRNMYLTKGSVTVTSVIGANNWGAAVTATANATALPWNYATPDNHPSSLFHELIAKNLPAGVVRAKGRS